jgi:hypothetical protein
MANKKISDIILHDFSKLLKKKPSKLLRKWLAEQAQRAETSQKF